MVCYLVRHGKDDETVRGGWSDAELCEEGITQVRDLSKQVHNLSIGCIYSSDLIRARQTAEILNEVFNVEIRYLPQFREVNNGLLAGMKNEMALIEYPGLFWSTLGWDEMYPQGESPKVFFERVSNAWKSFKDDVKDLPCDVMLVTHGGVMNVIQCLEHGRSYSNRENPYPVGYAEMIAIEI